MLGEEKNANPIPTQTNIAIIIQMGVVSFKNDNDINPIVHIDIPKVDKYLG